MHKIKWGPCGFSDRTFCKWILTKTVDIGIIQFEWMYVCLVVPPLLFIIFLIWKLKLSVKIIKASESLVLVSYYTFAWCVCVFTILGVTITVIANHVLSFGLLGGIALAALSAAINFIEISVVVFMLHNGSKLSNGAIMRRTAVISFIISVITNTTSEIINQVTDTTIWFKTTGYSQFYQFILSLVFFLMYALILILPCTRFKHKVPDRKTFYCYIAFLSLCYFFEVLGGILNLFCLPAGICLNFVGYYLYFAFFSPVLYFSFLNEWFRRDIWYDFINGTILQHDIVDDDYEDDDVATIRILPPQLTPLRPEIASKNKQITHQTGVPSPYYKGFVGGGTAAGGSSYSTAVDITFHDNGGGNLNTTIDEIDYVGPEDNYSWADMR